MPTNKPVIQAVVDEENFLKFQEICKKERRSKSQMGQIAIEEFIKNYEIKNGSISTGNISVQNSTVNNSFNIGHNN